MAAINKQVADQMPGAVWHPLERAGHFVAVGSVDKIFAIAAEEANVARLAKGGGPRQKMKQEMRQRRR